MQKYEITYFTALEEKTNAVESVVKELSGTLVSAKDLGTRELAYQVGRLKEGRFFEVIFEIDGEKLPELERKIKQDKKIVRFILIKALREKKIKEKRAKEKSVETPIKPAETVSPVEPPVEPIETETKTEAPIVSEPVKPEPAKEKKAVAKPAPKPKTKTRTKIKAEKPVKPAKTKKEIKESDTTSSAELDKKLQELVED